jgi:hypothetical protein
LPPASNFSFSMPDPFNPAPGTPFNPTPATPGGGFTPGTEPANPPDPFDDAPTPVISGGTGPNGEPVPGDTLSLSEVCPGQLTEWYVCNLDGTGCVLVNVGISPILFIPPEFTGKSLAGVGRCPDPGAPDGFGEGNASALTGSVGGGIEGSFAGPSVMGDTLLVRFRAPSGVYEPGNWLVPVGINGWFARSEFFSSTQVKWFFYPIRSDGSLGNRTVFPKELVSGNDVPVLNGTTLEFTLNNNPYTPPYGSQ